MAAFDWYQATVRHPVDDVIGAMLDMAEKAELTHAKGLQGYQTRTFLMEEGERIGEVWHGGTHQYPHVQFTGDAAQCGSIMIRKSFPEHFVARLDARQDYAEPGAFDSMQTVLLAAAERHRVKVGTAGDHLLRKVGRTVYLGAKSSAVQLRMYDKAEEMRQKFAHDPAKLMVIPEHLTRMESQVRPQSQQARLAMATIEPSQVFGASAWTREIWQAVEGMELDPVQVTRAWRASDDDRAYAYMLGAFGGVLRRRLLDHGSWAAVGAQIGLDLQEREEAIRSRKGSR